MSNAIVMCSNKGYLEHCFALFGSLKRQGIAKETQLILMVDSTVNSTQIDLCESRDIRVIKIKDGEHHFHLKYSVFESHLSIYDKICYLDADMSIVKNDVDIFANFNSDLGVDYEPFLLYETLISAAPKPLLSEQIKLLETISAGYAWNAGGFMYRGHILTDELKKEIQEIREKYRVVNYHVRGVQDGSDQPILNIALDKYKPQQSSLFAYWKKTTPDTVFAHCCADDRDRPWNNPLYKENYKLGLENFWLKG